MVAASDCPCATNSAQLMQEKCPLLFPGGSPVTRIKDTSPWDHVNAEKGLGGLNPEVIGDLGIGPSFAEQYAIESLLSKHVANDLSDLLGEEHSAVLANHLGG